jgi:hypothetical protein
MATYPPRITLPYRVSKRWLEERILAGEIVEPRHELTIELDRVDPEFRARAVAISKQVKPWVAGVEVIGSGIRPGDSFPDGSDDGPSVVDPVEERIGSLPELPEPSFDPMDLIDAYERWIERYQDMAAGALAAWIDRYADDDEFGLVVNADWWLRTIQWRVGDGPTRVCALDGRKDLPLFQRARGAWQAVEVAKAEGDDQAWEAAEEVVGTIVELPRKSADSGELVSAFEDLCERLAELTRAHMWTRQRQREGFDLEMRRWAFEKGSERLQMGIEDGYRMIPVYLTERIALEIPGFYAYLPKQRDGVSWQPRTGPSQAALTWRRAVQEQIDDHCPPGMTSPTAEIVWMKAPPEEMCDTSSGAYWVVDPDGEYQRRRVPFESIVVPEWLGRYTLIAGLISEAFTVPDYLLLKHVLHPDEYLLKGLPQPPEGGATIPDCDIPIDTGDFDSAPISPGVADDDIPF